MRAIVTPMDNPREVYALCINSISNEQLKLRMQAIATEVAAAALEYHEKVQAKNLFEIPEVDCRDEDVVIGEVTKKELSDTYSKHMRGPTKPARQVYNQLLASAPRRKCPYCGFGHASTLDHYLPKAKFPILSVLPWNLVPACKDCNTGKNAATATEQDQQTLHPYFEHPRIITDQWLYARVLTENPPVIEFFVDPPEAWHPVEKSRVLAHFRDYKLASRFSIEASNELASLKDTLGRVWLASALAGVQDHLRFTAEGKSAVHVNAWDTAMYQALVECEWYCDGGFRDFM